MSRGRSTEVELTHNYFIVYSCHICATYGPCYRPSGHLSWDFKRRLSLKKLSIIAGVRAKSYLSTTLDRHNFRSVYVILLFFPDKLMNKKWSSINLINYKVIMILELSTIFGLFVWRIFITFSNNVFIDIFIQLTTPKH